MEILKRVSRETGLYLGILGVAIVGSLLAYNTSDPDGQLGWWLLGFLGFLGLALVDFFLKSIGIKLGMLTIYIGGWVYVTQWPDTVGVGVLLGFATWVIVSIWSLINMPQVPKTAEELETDKTWGIFAPVARFFGAGR